MVLPFIECISPQSSSKLVRVYKPHPLLVHVPETNKRRTKMEDGSWLGFPENKDESKERTLGLGLVRTFSISSYFKTKSFPYLESSSLP